jgi:hypothetical protein
MKNTLLVAISLISLSGCATLFAKKNIDVSLPDGATVDGQGASGHATLKQSETHTVQYADGTSCTIDSGVGWPWVVLDLFTTGPLGLIIDGVTGNWKHLDDNCPGVTGD